MIRSEVLLSSSWMITTLLLESGKSDGKEVGFLCLWAVLCCGTEALCVSVNSFVQAPKQRIECLGEVAQWLCACLEGETEGGGSLCGCHCAGLQVGHHLGSKLISCGNPRADFVFSPKAYLLKCDIPSIETKPNHLSNHYRLFRKIQHPKQYVLPRNLASFLPAHQSRPRAHQLRATPPNARWRVRGFHRVCGDRGLSLPSVRS